MNPVQINLGDSLSSAVKARAPSLPQGAIDAIKDYVNNHYPKGCKISCTTHRNSPCGEGACCKFVPPSSITSGEKISGTVTVSASAVKGSVGLTVEYSPRVLNDDHVYNCHPPGCGPDTLTVVWEIVYSGALHFELEVAALALKGLGDHPSAEREVKAVVKKYNLDGLGTVSNPHKVDIEEENTTSHDVKVAAGVSFDVEIDIRDDGSVVLSDPCP